MSEPNEYLSIIFAKALEDPESLTVEEHMEMVEYVWVNYLQTLRDRGLSDDSLSALLDKAFNQPWDIEILNDGQDARLVFDGLT